MDPLILGKDAGSNTSASITLAQQERRRGLYILGKTGTGKTTLLINLMLQDIAAGFGLCFLDPHGDAISDILMRLPDHRVQDVILLDVTDTEYPFGLNLYECSNPQDIELVARTTEQVMHVWEKLWDVSRSTPRMAQYLRNCTLTLIENPGSTMVEIPLLLTDETYRQNLVRNVTNTQVQLFWRRYNSLRLQEQLDRSESTLNKVDEFLSQTILQNIVGQAHTTIDFQSIMNEGKILLVKLPGRFEDITSLLGSIIIGQLLNAALSRANKAAQQRRQFNLYADEFQRFSTPDMASLLVEARKYAICSCIAHQFRSQLDEANRGATLNAASLVVFRITGEDAIELAKEFDATPPPPDVIGQRPILAPKRDVLDHLCKNGHRVPEVTHFATHYLVPAKDLLARYNRQAYIFLRETKFFEHPTLFSVADLRTGLDQLNTLLYEVMRERDAQKPLPPLVILIITMCFKTQHGIAGCYRYDVSSYDFQMENGRSKVEFYNDMSTLCSPEIFRHLDQLRQRYGMGKKTEKFTWVIQYITALRKTMEVLAQEPILIDTGQHEPIFDKPRTYADVQNQIANELVGLKNGMARVKLPTGEYHLRVLLPSTPKEQRSPERLQERITAIRARNIQERYLLPRNEVEKAIRRRQRMPDEPTTKRRG